jgi:hypothetical protein
MCHLRWRQSLAVNPGGAVIVILALLELPYRLARLRGSPSRVLLAWGPIAERCLLAAALGVALAAWLYRVALA